MKQDTIDVSGDHNDSTSTKLLLKYIMKRHSPTSAVPVETDENHISTSYKNLFRGTDLDELYEEKKASLLLSFSKVELNGSGWLLDKIEKLIVKIADYRPFQMLILKHKPH